MNKPKRVLFRRGVKMAPGTVYCGRPTRWGNPYIIGKDSDRGFVTDQVVAIKFYSELIANNEEFKDKVRRELRGKDLACWCKSEPCRASVLLEIANGDDYSKALDAIQKRAADRAIDLADESKLKAEFYKAQAAVGLVRSYIALLEASLAPGASAGAPSSQIIIQEIKARLAQPYA